MFNCSLYEIEDSIEYMETQKKRHELAIERALNKKGSNPQEVQNIERKLNAVEVAIASLYYIKSVKENKEGD